MQQNNNDHIYNDQEIEIRSVDGGNPIIHGYAALYNSRSRTMYTEEGHAFVEEIAPGAFNNSNFSGLQCAFNHKDFLCKPPYLRYGIDERGLWYEYEHDPTDPDHQRTLSKIRRKDVTGSSFKFTEVKGENQIISKTETGVTLRRIIKFDHILDVAPATFPAYAKTTAFARSLDAAYETDTEPTEAQKEAGNYKKGKVKVQGMTISIENPIGAKRSGVAKDGTEWSVEMKAHYGYILGASARDGDNLDVFLTKDAETAHCVFVIDQITDTGEFDEHKCIIGPANQDDARNIYLSHYTDGWRGLGAISYVPMECFRAWAMDGKTKRKPLKYMKEETETETKQEPAETTPELPAEAPEAEPEAVAEQPEEQPEESRSQPEVENTETEAITRMKARIQHELAVMRR